MADAAADSKNKYTAKVQYLIGYNLVCFIGWSACLAITWKSFVHRTSTEKLYDVRVLGRAIVSARMLAPCLAAPVSGLVNSNRTSVVPYVVDTISWGLVMADTRLFGCMRVTVAPVCWTLLSSELVPTLAYAVNAGNMQEVILALKITQTLAILEVVHAALGLVRSPVFTTAQQVASRIFIVWGILTATPQAIQQGCLTLARIGGISFGLDLFSLLFAWGVTEVIRYSFYALKEVGSVPALLTWLRYTTFIVLYPIGVSSELAMVWLALPVLRSTGLWSLDMPNQFNMVFNYYIFCMLMMLAYAPGFPPLYMYMFRQRKKILSASKIKES